MPISTTIARQDVTACILCSRNCGLSVEVENNQFKKIKGDEQHPFSQGYICQKAARLQHYQQHADRLTHPYRTMVVFDPRVTETAKQADIHVQLKPGTDSYLMSAMIAIMLRKDLYDQAFIQKHTHGFEQVKQAFSAVPIEQYIEKADVSVELIYQIVRDFAKAKRGCVRIDLGIQHTLNTTLNGYLEKLLYLLAGHFGKQGTNNLHTMFIPILTNTDERNPKYRRTVHHKMFPISGFFPPNILPDEILKAGEKRVRAVFVDSCNPLLTYPDTTAYEQAFQSLELLVVVDVAMTETARLAHYVLPAHSQFEKWEFTGFNLEFPQNGFHLRHPLFKAQANTLPEAEIYTRLLEAMGAIPKQFPLLYKIAQKDSPKTAYLGYFAALAASFVRNKKLVPFAASIVYRTLGQTLPNDAASTALLLPLCMQYSAQHYKAVKQAGYKGNRLTLGVNLFQAILQKRSGVILSKHNYDDVWDLVAYKDKKIHLAIPEMLIELAQLNQQTQGTSEQFPFILLAGERRSYNANQIYRDPAWRKVDAEGRLRMNPEDAIHFGVDTGHSLQCISEHGRITVVVEIDEGMRKGVVSLPHGYGLRYSGGQAIGPELNRLTSLKHCDPLSKTPYHKYVPVRLEKPAA